MTPLEKIRDKVAKHCSEDRIALLEPILIKLEEHKNTPASTGLKKHGAFEGGLLAHTNTVMDLAFGFAHTIHSKIADLAVESGELPSNGVSGESIVTCVLVHDLNKVCDLGGNPHYIPSILTGGKQSEKKPWKTSDDCLPIQNSIAAGVPPEITQTSEVFLLDPSIQYPSGLTSLVLANHWSPGFAKSLTPDEKQAIVWHGGRYEKGNQAGFANSESLLWLVIHSADFGAAIMGI